jgi:hypothetical protein
MVAMEPIYPFGKDWEELAPIPPSQPAISVWVIFLYSIVENFFLTTSRRYEEARRFASLREFLQFDVDYHVQFVVRILPSFSHADEQVDAPRQHCEDRLDKGENDERLVFDLLEFLKLAAPSNMNSVCQKLKAEQGEAQVAPVCGPTIIHRRGSLSRLLEEIVATGRFDRYRAYALCLCLESVITPSERLDVPFAFRIS